VPKKPLAKKTGGSSTGDFTLETRHARELGRAITYELRHVLCGKRGCSKLHGPYWYAYWSAGGRVRHCYIGKEFRSVKNKRPDLLRGSRNGN
jgi:hypothetical protein